MNNYDISSTGVNLDLACFYDCDLARIYFDDCFIKDDHALTQYRSDDVYQYIDHGNIGAINLASIDAYKATKADILAIYEGLEVYNFFGGAYDLKAGASEYLGKPFSKLTKDELVQYLEHELSADDLIKAYQEYLTPLYEIVTIRGYSQGDYAEIIIPDSYWLITGAKKTDESLSKLADYFTNLFYDAPVYARLDIDGSEFFFDEYMQDQYRYDKDELLAMAEKQITHDKKAYILNWLADNLPDHPDYC